jgi:hypothetical protein
MKNIHVLPTDKPSRVYKHLGRELKYTSRNFEQKGLLCINQNIYINSDEEIKEGDYYIGFIVNPKDFKGNNIPNEIVKADLNKTNEFLVKPFSNYCKKIILTTDPDLIADGIQAIDDDFLQWFVKNPSCEFVETFIDVMGCTLEHCNANPCINYKIIIPKEEHKQETLEEAAKIYAKIPIVKSVDEEERHYNSACKLYDAFKAGANWQAETVYSEGEVISIAKKYAKRCQAPIQDTKWFEQFKKK